MAYKGTVVRGTPVNHISSGGAGINPGKPAGMVGTVKEQYDSDRRGYQSDPRGGTPYQSDRGNPGDALRVAEGTGPYGVVIDPAAGDQADPAANGRGVVLDKADDVSRGYSPQGAPTLDSPVPRHAPVFDTGFVEEENIEHLGKGTGPTAPTEEMGRDNLLKIGGVMSR